MTNVLPGMQAAFVDIGLSKDAFLYAGDYTANLGDYERLMLSDSEEEDLEVEKVERREAPPPLRTCSAKARRCWSRSPRSRWERKGPCHLVHFPSGALPGLYAAGPPHRRLPADPGRS